ncbi:MAG: lipase family protein [Myxococcales bacterium]|nr:lipase family protein [Myxococcales bacterium]
MSRLALLGLLLWVYPPHEALAQPLLDWIAHTRGRMIDVYSPGDSEEHLLATGLTMATLSRASYRDDPADRRGLIEGAHFEEVHFADRSGTDAQALVVRDQRALVVAFRGTEKNSARDNLLNFSAVTSLGVFRGAHAGFASSVVSLAPSLTDVIREQRRQHGPLEVWLTGHSLGGAMAQIYAMHLRDVNVPVAGVVTFGSPAPGKGDFSNLYGRLAERTHRFENDEDIIPCLPPDEMAWVQNGHVHVLYEDHADVYATGGSECRSIPSALLGMPFCDARPKLRRALGFIFPGSTLSCEIPDPLVMFSDYLLDVLDGRGRSLHGIGVYRDRLAQRIPHRVVALVGD